MVTMRVDNAHAHQVFIILCSRVVLWCILYTIVRWRFGTFFFIQLNVRRVVVPWVLKLPRSLTRACLAHPSRERFQIKYKKTNNILLFVLDCIHMYIAFKSVYARVNKRLFFHCLTIVAGWCLHVERDGI